MTVIKASLNLSCHLENMFRTTCVLVSSRALVSFRCIDFVSYWLRIRAINKSSLYLSKGGGGLDYNFTPQYYLNILSLTVPNR